MQIEVKDILPWLAGALSIGTIANRFKNYGIRLTNLERRHTTKNGESLLMSYKAHDKICEPQKATFIEIKDHLKKTDDKLELILVAVTELKTVQKRQVISGD